MQTIHEIKHDGFRIIARKDGERVTLYSRPGNDFTRRFSTDCSGADPRGDCGTYAGRGLAQRA